MKAFLDIKRIRTVTDILLQLNHKNHQSIQQEFNQHIRPLSTENIILLLQEIKQNNPAITWEMIRDFYATYDSFYMIKMDDTNIPDTNIKNHPIQVFKQENEYFTRLLTHLGKQFEKPLMDMEQIQKDMKQLGEIYRHYNRKEKLFFPILERYGILNPLRLMWADDDRVRTLYKGAKSMVEHLPDIDISHVNNAFFHFEKACQDVVCQETYFLMPLAKAMLKEHDWSAIAKESSAFGYAVETPDYEGLDLPGDDKSTDHTEHLRIGNGFLTMKEADHILNHLPLEITFIDKNGLFKYFNDVVEASEMMFIRTPSSIGRHVANCHPPKSLKKVMKVIRDLKSKKRSSETMWFKKGEQFIHVTYQALFDENDEYLGILEYVQDSQAFLNLPRATKKEVSSYNE